MTKIKVTIKMMLARTTETNVQTSNDVLSRNTVIFRRESIYNYILIHKTAILLWHCLSVDANAR